MAGELRDAYVTWDEFKYQATDTNDGLPDKGMVDLVEDLRASGEYVTFQSCYGHEGELDGHLWVTPGKPLRNHRGDLTFDRTPFSRVQHVIVGPVAAQQQMPRGYWEYWWEPSKAEQAVSWLRWILLEDGILPRKEGG